VLRVPRSVRSAAALELVDVAGRVVRRLDLPAASLDVPASRGDARGSESVEVPWDGRDDAGRPVAPGIYYWLARARGLPIASGAVVVSP
jgi:hypothetical protein